MTFRIDVVTIFPEYLAPLRQSLLGKAAERGLVTIAEHDQRGWTDDVHRTVDDAPSGGGPGMVMRPEPWAEALRDTELHVAVADLPDLDDPDAFYDHQLVGLAARLTDGTPLGEVAAVRHEGGDLLVVRRPEGGELLIPFVAAIVPTVDVAGGVVVVDPPEGLLDL